jgi:predicted Ser/Thr protein kinase
MADTIPSTCPRCASPMSATDAAGLCPRCLLAMNFQTRTMPTGADAASSPPPTPAELAEKFPQFEILECLGRGGMGIVYKARQKALDRIVAIKILAGEWQDAPGFAERFEKEAKLLAKLNHPNIVTIHDFGNAGGLFHIVMEFIDGVNVRDLLRDGKMPAEQALAIVPPICDALQFAHDHGIVHRDIKPENILLDREGRVKIADFGIATLAGDAADRSGTPAYMAPEQEVHSARIDHRADIYALGVVLYEMLTGERPTTSPVAPSKRVMIDVRLDEVVLRALESIPELRFQSAVEFHTVLEQAVESAVLNGPAGASGPPRAELPESPRSAVVEAAPWTLARTLKLVAIPVAALAVVWYSGVFDAGAPLASQPEEIIYLNLMWTVGVVVALMLLAGKSIHWIRSRRAGKSGEGDPDAAESPLAKGASTLPGLLLHFAPALLLVVAWLTSGLEKGAVLILSVVLVAVSVLFAVRPRRNSKPGNKKLVEVAAVSWTPFGWAAILLLALSTVSVLALAATGMVMLPRALEGWVMKLMRPEVFLAVMAVLAAILWYYRERRMPTVMLPAIDIRRAMVGAGLVIGAVACLVLGSDLIMQIGFKYQHPSVWYNGWLAFVALLLLTGMGFGVLGRRHWLGKFAVVSGISMLLQTLGVGGSLQGVRHWHRNGGFGPEVERIVPMSAPGIPCVLDFETGDLLEASKSGLSGDVTFAQGGLLFLTGRTETPLPREGADPVERSFSSWTVDEVMNPTVGTRSHRLFKDPSGRPVIAPLSTPFRTSDGNRGVLEIRPIFDEGSGVVIALRVRYKLHRFH